MKVLYVADDGKQFDDEEECEQYEYRKKWETGDNIIFGLNREGKTIEYSNPNFSDEVMFIAVKTREAIESLKERTRCEDLPTEGIMEPGAYYWDENSQIWIKAATKVHELEEQLSLLEWIIEKTK